MNRIIAIEAALRCFACGLLALVPILGVPFGLAALAFYGKSAAGSSDGWNPAQRHARAGVACAGLGLLANTTGLWWFLVLWFTKEI